MARRSEDLRCVVDVYGAIHRRMEDEKGPSQAADPLPLIVRAQVVDERTAHLESAAAQLHFGLALVKKRLEVFAKQSCDVLNVERRPDGRNGLHVGQIGGRGQYRRPAEAVTNKKGRLNAGTAHGAGCHQH
ncbi:MAG TPA: hypothetical protein VLJ17_01160, partial [Xanthobacteraceae bacterium]|nr:hypothetical protein [Xanthobacteraceae bacterium]